MAEPFGEEHGGVRPEAVRQGHEPFGANVWGVVLFGIGLLLTIGAVLGLMVLLARAFSGDQAQKPPRPEALAQPRRLPPPPHVAPNQALELQEQRARLNELLGSYGWIDREAGIARIPIERAIELLAQRDFRLPAATEPAESAQQIEPADPSESTEPSERCGPNESSQPAEEPE